MEREDMRRSFLKSKIKNYANLQVVVLVTVAAIFLLFILQFSCSIGKYKRIFIYCKKGGILRGEMLSPLIGVVNFLTEGKGRLGETAAVGLESGEVPRPNTGRREKPSGLSAKRKFRAKKVMTSSKGEEFSCFEKRKLPIRIGYSSLTPIHCHIGEVFSRTKILEKYQLDATLISFRRGDEQGRAIQEGKVDVAFSCEVPAVLTLAANPNMRIIATPGELGRIALLVLETSGISSLTDLKGKKIGLNEVTTSHKDFINWIEEVSLKAEKDISIVNLTQDEMEKALIGRLVDAIVTWDPWVETMTRRGNLRIIRNRTFCSVVVMSWEYIDKCPEGAIRYLQALKEALFWAATHKDKTNLWVAEKSGWDLDVVRQVSKFNKNFYDAIKIDDIDISLNKENIQILEDCAAFLKGLRAIPGNFNLDKSLDLDLLPGIQKDSLRRDSKRKI